MLVERTISIQDFAHAIAETFDLAAPALSNHHNRVAYIARNIANEMALPAEEVQDITLAALLHDIGSFSFEERKRLHSPNVSEADTIGHSVTGYRLLRGFQPLSKAAVMIAYHHTPYDPRRNDIPFGSYVIHLADRVAAQLDEDREVFMQLPEIAHRLTASGGVFHPEVLASFKRLTSAVYAWIEVYSPALGITMLNKMEKNKRVVGTTELRSMAKVFAHIIDFRSRYTATHSSGVATVAKEIAHISGFSENECSLIEIAGYLHDLGKLAVPNTILEKPGPLDEAEWVVMRKHTYYTYSILSRISGFEDIATWAAYHHERLDGSGYPFHVPSRSLSKLSRVMAVADVVTALSEDRPYRLGMAEGQVFDILLSQAVDGALDQMVVDLVIQNYRSINNARINAQANAQAEYDEFNSEDALELRMHQRSGQVIDTIAFEGAYNKNLSQSQLSCAS